MRTTSSAYLLLFGSILFSCQTSPETGSSTGTTSEKDATQANKLTFRQQSLVKKSDNCPGDSCASVELQYLVAQDGLAPLRDSLNQYMETYLMRLQLMNNPDADLTPKGDAAEVVAATFLQQHATFTKDNPGAGAMAGWYLKVTSEAIYQTPAVLSWQIKSEGYSGGAHGYAMTNLQTFDSIGHALELHEMVLDTVQFRKRVEQEFRNVRKLGTESLEKQGFYTQAGNLPFPQNAALTPEGLLLYYNAYEVNAYAFGATKVLLPYAQLKGLLKPRYLNQK